MLIATRSTRLAARLEHTIQCNGRTARNAVQVTMQTVMLFLCHGYNIAAISSKRPTSVGSYVLDLELLDFGFGQSSVAMAEAAASKVWRESLKKCCAEG